MAPTRTTPLQSPGWDTAVNIIKNNSWLRELHGKFEEGLPEDRTARFEIITTNKNKYVAEVKRRKEEGKLKDVWAVVEDWSKEKQRYVRTDMFFDVPQHKVVGWREYMGQ